MERKQNTAFLLKQWVPVIVIFIVLLFSLGVLIIQGKYTTVIVGIAGAGGAYGFIRFSTISQGNRLLQANSPQPFIDFYNKQLSGVSIAHRDAHLAFSKSLVYTLYGQFENARLEVEKVDWKKKPPFFNAQKVFLQSLWAYLETHDFQQGTVLAKEARLLADVSSSFPGAGISHSAFDIAVEVGELLSRSFEPNMATKLEQKIKKSPVQMKVFGAWGLEGFYNQSGEYEQAQKMRLLITELAPYCAGLESI